jgi:hypothetical protein
MVFAIHIGTVDLGDIFLFLLFALAAPYTIFLLIQSPDGIRMAATLNLVELREDVLSR